MNKSNRIGHVYYIQVVHHEGLGAINFSRLPLKAIFDICLRNASLQDLPL